MIITGLNNSIILISKLNNKCRLKRNLSGVIVLVHAAINRVKQAYCIHCLESLCVEYVGTVITLERFIDSLPTKRFAALTYGLYFIYSLLKRMETKYIAVGVVREEIFVYVSYCGVTKI